MFDVYSRSLFRGPIRVILTVALTVVISFLVLFGVDSQNVESLSTNRHSTAGGNSEVTVDDIDESSKHEETRARSHETTKVLTTRPSQPRVQSDELFASSDESGIDLSSADTPPLESSEGSNIVRIGLRHTRLSSIHTRIFNGVVPRSAAGKRSRFALQSFVPITSSSGEVGIELRNSANGAAAEQLLYPSLDNTLTRRLSKDGARPPDEDVSLIAPLLGKHCPIDRFVTVNTHTWGRHHNQLQEIMNTIAWAETLNRTAIISYFRYNHAWHSVDNFYDFTEIRKRYCVVTHKEADSLLKLRSHHNLPRLTSRCLGQGTKSTRFKHLNHVDRCPSKLDLPAHYNARHSVKITKKMILEYVVPNSDGFFMLSGQIAFYMRSGVWATAMLYRHLKPSAAVAALVNAELLSTFFPQQDEGSRGDVTLALSKHRIVQSSTASLFPIYPYFSVHSRSRERDCLLEMSYDEVDNEGFLASMSGGDGLSPNAAASRSQGVVVATEAPLTPGASAVWREARQQCKIQTELVDTILAEVKPGPGTRLFLASDGQNKEFEQSMQARQAIKVDGAKFGNDLLSMAVDFFLMTQGAYFTGNQISSVSQNVCFVRLGNGLTCDGWFPIWTLYHLRHALSTVIGPPPKTN